MEFKNGDKVGWTSAANGSWKTKIGTIVGITKYKGVVRYEVSVPAPEGSTAKPKLYFPHTSALKLLD